MTVHIGEVHTDVVPVGTAGSAGGARRGGPVDAQRAADQLYEALQRAHWLAGRVAAEGFDD